MEKKALEYILRRGVAEIIVEEELRRLLEAGQPLRLKMGFDPSRPDIHLGHVVGLRKLRQLQELGHQVILIVGDWTARIGDPSGQSVTRPMLTEEEVRANAETYMKQFFRVVDREKTQVAWQSQWFDAFTLAEVIRLASRFTVAQFLAREDFNRRYTSGKPVALHELLYPLLQAYDSVAIQADVEFGGTDQKFNLLVGRELQAMLGQRPQQCFLMPLLVGTDGVQKMSKSLDNYIAIEDPPHEMFGKVMSLPDSLILPYFELVTDVPDEELAGFRRQLDEGSVNPMILKQRLAREIVAQFHGPEAARAAEAHFERAFQKREAPEEIAEYPLSLLLQHFEQTSEDPGYGYIYSPETGEYDIPLFKALVFMKLVRSHGEARRLLAKGAIEIDGKVVSRARERLRVGSVIRVGKRRFLKIVNTDIQT